MPSVFAPDDNHAVGERFEDLKLYVFHSAYCKIRNLRKYGYQQSVSQSEKSGRRHRTTPVYHGNFGRPRNNERIL